MHNATVLNTDFLYLGETTFARALRLVRRGRAEIVRDRGEVRTVSMKFRIPEIIRMLSMVDFRRRMVPLTKRNILERDEYTCQYCSGTHGRMTVDHVRPRSKGSPESWENLVCACTPCNSCTMWNLAGSCRKLIRLALRPLLPVIEVGTWTLKFCS